MKASQFLPGGGNGIAQIGIGGRQRAVESRTVRLHGRADRQVPPQRKCQQLVHDEVALAWGHLPHHRLRNAAVLQAPGGNLGFWEQSERLMADQSNHSQRIAGGRILDCESNTQPALSCAEPFQCRNALLPWQAKVDAAPVGS